MEDLCGRCEGSAQVERFLVDITDPDAVCCRHSDCQIGDIHIIVDGYDVTGSCACSASCLFPAYRTGIYARRLLAPAEQIANRLEEFFSSPQRQFEA